MISLATEFCAVSWHMSTLMSNTVILSRSRDGTNAFFKADESKVIVGIDVRGWLSMTCFEHGSNDQNTSNMKDTQCSVCLESISIGQNVCTFACGHTLHFECADVWITKCIQSYQPAPCPLCNGVILSPVFHCPPPVEEVSEITVVGAEIQVSEIEQVVLEIRGGFLRRKIEFIRSRWFRMWTT